MSLYTGTSMGWAVSQYTGQPHCTWWARFGGEIREGTASTWAEAVGAAKSAYEELEAAS